MRQVKFRGKKILTPDEWIHGNLIIDAFLPDNNYFDARIVSLPDEPYGWFQIVPDSCCQFTGLHDEKGTEIYEHDIVKWYMSGDFKIAEIIWHEKKAIFCLKHTNDQVNVWPLNPEKYKVVGNSIDDPNWKQLLNG